MYDEVFTATWETLRVNQHSTFVALYSQEELHIQLIATEQTLVQVRPCIETLQRSEVRLDSDHIHQLEMKSWKQQLSKFYCLILNSLELHLNNKTLKLDQD